MAQKTDQQLLAASNVIKNETQPNANSKVRISNLFQDIIDSKVNNSTFTGSTFGGGVTGATNFGGIGIYGTKTNNVLNFKGLIAGSNITLTPSSTGITISSSGGGSSGGNFVSASTFNTYTASTQTAISGKVNTTLFNTYTGSTSSVINGKVNSSLFNTYTGATQTALGAKLATTLFNTYTGATQTTLGLKLNTSLFNSYTGATNTQLSLTVSGATNVGSGNGNHVLFAQKTGKNLDFKRLIAGANITLTSSSTGITIASSGGGAAKVIQLAVSDELTSLTTGITKMSFRMPYAMTLTAIRGSLGVAQLSGSSLTVDVNEGGSSILSTKLTFDNTEKTTTTAAIPAVISDTILADDAEITIDIDQIGNNSIAKGLKITLIGN